MPLAHRLLDAVVIVPEIDAHYGYKNALNNLEGWNRKIELRQGRWFFVGVGSAGESGPAMLRMFREANGMTSDSWQRFFVTAKELPGLNLSAYDSVVFVDDFAGTGTQVVNYWPILAELVASEARCHLILTAATEYAAKKISDKTELILHCSIILEEGSNLFSESSKLFSKDERVALDHYGNKAWSAHPRGFGGCGVALVLSHKTPNNSLPVLHANHDGWVGPFPRNLIQR